MSYFSYEYGSGSSRQSLASSASYFSDEDELLQSNGAADLQLNLPPPANAPALSRTQAWVDAGHAPGQQHLPPSISTPVWVRSAIESAYQETLNRAGYPRILKALKKVRVYDIGFSGMARDVKIVGNAIRDLFLKKRAEPFNFQGLTTYAEKPPAYEEHVAPQSADHEQSSRDTFYYFMPGSTPALNQQGMQETADVTTPAQNLVYEGSSAGRKAREQAEAEGQGQAFEDSVQAMLGSLGPCSSKFRWYNTKLGYLCAGGNHLVYHRQIDDWAADPKTVRPRVALVNTFNTPWSPISPYIGLIGNWDGHPPSVDFWQPMHTMHQEYMQKARLAGMLSWCKSTLGDGIVESSDAWRPIKQSGPILTESVSCFKSNRRKPVALR